MFWNGGRENKSSQPHGSWNSEVGREGEMTWAEETTDTYMGASMEKIQCEAQGQVSVLGSCYLDPKKQAQRQSSNVVGCNSA